METVLDAISEEDPEQRESHAEKMAQQPVVADDVPLPLNRNIRMQQMCKPILSTFAPLL
jgi:hypothetical protein